jgi:deoxyribodipyrimidine photolyase-related protein
MNEGIFIFGTQLSKNYNSWKDFPKKGHVCMVETPAEVYLDQPYKKYMNKYPYMDRIRHHSWKLVACFSGMRHFAEELKKEGYLVHYKKIDDEKPHSDFISSIIEWAGKNSISKIRMTTSLEAHGKEVIESLRHALLSHKISLEVFEDNSFLMSEEDNKTWFKKNSSTRLENYYRTIRARYGWLMKSSKTPEGGKWNFDKENREPYRDVLPSPPPSYSPDACTKEVIEIVARLFPEQPGTPHEFNMPVTRAQALDQLNSFINNSLYNFGRYEDAMRAPERGNENASAVLFHSQLSFLMNMGLLWPQEVIEAACTAFYKGSVPLASVEAFIRQIAGWREYCRGFYQAHMPELREANYFNFYNKLPDFFWNANTDLNCLKYSLQNVLKTGYNHHIQRLMIIGNFALLMETLPAAVAHWFWSLYIDAYEWVELPNVAAMSQFADGGNMASKPYISGGAYIHKMSNYCATCPYATKGKPNPLTHEYACPYTLLYWNFLISHEEKLRKNFRMAPQLRSVKKLSENEKKDIMHRAKKYMKLLRDNGSLYEKKSSQAQ